METFRKIFETTETNELVIATSKAMNQYAVFKDGKLFGSLMFKNGERSRRTPMEYSERGGDFSFVISDFDGDKTWKEIASKLEKHYKMKVKIDPKRKI